MKRLKLLLAGAILLGSMAVHVWIQDGRIVFGSEMTGLILTKGGYRCWSVSWSDGKVFDGKKWRPVSFIGPERAPIDFRIGYRWPRYRHADYRGLTFMTNQSVAAP